MKRGVACKERRRREEVTHLLLRASEVIAGWERFGVAEYAQFFANPLRVVWVNVLGGLARGVGVAVGFTIVTAVLLWFLGRLARLNLPIIGQFVADIARIVEHELTFSR